MAKHHTVKAYREVGLKLWAMLPWGPLGFFSGSSGLIEILHSFCSQSSFLLLYFCDRKKIHIECLLTFITFFIRFIVYYVGSSVYLAHITGHYTNCFL
jgi:hypothetical protein